ncbi:hypothetical protein MC378_04270 [Polaribacter sp. MSW13]|uniref:Outer membrane protein beta-barrel domain-containing protein n=1 Tax=Polaribacter marinus TaxID=2916838 RepID=A0A9X2AIA5_9FLAO|nr:hypothetical protein [Polaribacter marinus]MCI2228371.1 hypothetical protein [Polaribacter marinus]
MKKVLLIAAFAIFGLGTVNAQGGFSGGVNLGIPVGDVSDFSSFSFGVDLNYMFNADEDFTYGAAAGYQNYSGKDGFDSTGFIPLAVVGRYAVSDKFSLGADVGYALGASTGNDGGFYYRPMVVYGLSDSMNLNASYSGVSVTGGTYSNIGLGIMFDF